MCSAGQAEVSRTLRPSGRGWGSRCGQALVGLPHSQSTMLPVLPRPFMKLKENGRANISRSSSSTSSFSSTAGEGEAMEECDSGVSVSHSIRDQLSRAKLVVPCSKITPCRRSGLHSCSYQMRAVSERTLS